MYAHFEGTSQELADLQNEVSFVNRGRTDGIFFYLSGSGDISVSASGWALTPETEERELKWFVGSRKARIVKTALELHREFNIQYANVAAHRNPTFSMYEYLMEKYEALNKQRIAEGIEPLKLSALEARYQELKSGSLSTSESLAFIERCLKTSEVEPQAGQNKNNLIPAKGRINSD